MLLSKAGVASEGVGRVCHGQREKWVVDSYLRIIPRIGTLDCGVGGWVLSQNYPE